MKHFRIESMAMPITVIILVAAGIYLNAIPGEFVYDDMGVIPGNPWIKDAGYLPEIFSSGVWEFHGQESNYYRPLLHVILMVDYHLFGLQPWGYHLTNIVLHAGVSVLVFFIAIRCFQGEGGGIFAGASIRLPALAAALLFAAHPIHTESVTWISGVTDVSFSLFYLLAFYLYISADDRRGMGLVLAPVCFFLASLCKETALTLPILLFAYDVVMRRDASMSLAGMGVLIKRYLPFLLVALVYFALRGYAIGEFAPQQKHKYLSVYEYFINIFPLFTQYLGKLLLPINLNVAHVFHPISSLWTWQGGMGLLTTVAFITAVYVFGRRNRLAAFALLWVVIPLLPVLYIPALGLNTFAERYLYLPSVGFVLLLAMGLGRLSVMVVPRRAAAAMGASTLLITGLYAAGTIERNSVWHDNLTLWSDAVAKSPDGYNSHNNLGDAYSRLGLTEKAAQEYGIALKALAGEKPGRLLKLGVAYRNRGMFDIAVEQFLAALRADPEYAEAYYELGRSYESKRMPDQALQAYESAVQKKPDLVSAHYHLGMLLAQKGELDRAIEAFQTALRLRPDHLIHNNLGVVFAMQDKAGDATNQFRLALEIKPDYAEAHYNLGVSHEEKGEADGAIAEYLNAIRLQPEHVDARYSLALLYKQQGFYAKAEEQLRQILRVAPGYSGARDTLADIQGLKTQSGSNGL